MNVRMAVNGKTTKDQTQIRTASVAISYLKKKLFNKTCASLATLGSTETDATLVFFLIIVLTSE
jgi:hypothetical protein